MRSRAVAIKLMAPVLVAVALCCVGVSLSQPSAAVSDAAASDSQGVQLQSGPSGSWRLVVGSESISSEKLAAQRTKLGGIEISPSSSGSGFLLKADDDLQVTIAEMGNVKLTISAGSEVDMRPDFTSHLLQIQPVRNGRNPLLLELSDGARAEMPAGAQARLDHFADGTYSMMGRDGVVAITASGQRIKLAANSLPLMGGPLVESSDSNKDARLERKRPMSMVTIGGSLSDALQIQIGDAVLRLEAGEQRKVSLENGSSVEFGFDAETQRVTWDVQKGSFQFAVAKLKYWTVYGFTGQSASQQWDLATQTVDLQNTSNDPQGSLGRDLLLPLSRDLNAVVSPGATFLYAGGASASTFATAASGGPVLLYNRFSGQVVDLEQSNAYFTPQSMAKASSGSQPASSVNLSWNGESNAKVLEGGRITTVGENSSELIESASGTSLEVEQLDKSQVIVRSRGGTVNVALPDLLPEGHLQVPEGSVVVLRFDQRNRVVSFDSGTENTTPFKIVSASGTSLSTSSKVTFMLQRGAFSDATSPGLAYFEAAGASGDGSVRAQPSFIPQFTGRGSSSAASASLTRDGIDVGRVLDVSRIEQPPVSILR